MITPYVQWTENSQKLLHSKNNEPAVVCYHPDTMIVKSKAWYHNGLLHRDKYPALVIYNLDGDVESTSWYQFGYLQRDNDLPSCIRYHKNIPVNFFWFKNNVLHRDNNLPAYVIYDDTGKNLMSEFWYNEGNLMRIRHQY